MKQVYAICQKNNGNADGDFAIRASSPGLDPLAQEAARLAASAGLRVSEGMSFDRSPTRLALVQTPQVGRVLCHATWVGPDPERFFAHMLLNVPETFDTGQVVQTWGSPLWQQGEAEGPTELPEMPYLPVATALDDAALSRFLGLPKNRDLLQFVISAILTTPPDVRIFVAAPANDVALCVYGLTRALPSGLLERFTFSTYESDPLAAQMRLIGTSWDQPAEQPTQEESLSSTMAIRDLPAECYSGMNVAFNTYSRRASDVRIVPFAEFAVEALGDNKLSALDEFQSTWQRLGLKDVMLFDLVYRLARGTGAMTKEESADALQNPALAAWISARPDALRQFLEWALEDQQFASNAFSRAVMALRQKPETLAKLAHTVETEGLAALKRGERQRTATALEVILPMVAPPKATAIWGELLTRISDPDILTWEMRWYLLPKLIRYKTAPEGRGASIMEARPTSAMLAVPTDPSLDRWVRVPAEQIAALLSLEVPKSYHLQGCLKCLERQGEPSGTLARALAPYPQLVMTILQQVAGKMTPPPLQPPPAPPAPVPPPVVPPAPVPSAETTVAPPRVTETSVAEAATTQSAVVETATDGLPANQSPLAEATVDENPPVAVPVAETVEGEVIADVATMEEPADRPLTPTAPIPEAPAPPKVSPILDQALFQVILAEAPHYPWMEELIRAGQAMPGPVLDRCLECAFAAKQVNAERLVRAYGLKLLELYGGRHGLDEICKVYYATPPADLIYDVGLLEFARKSREVSGLCEEVTTRRDAALDMHEFMTHPSLDSLPLSKTAAALAKTPPLFPADTLDKVVGKISGELSRNASSPTIQAGLEESLLQIGPLYPGQATALYRKLLGMQKENKAFWKQSELLHAFFAVALGAMKSPDLAQRLDDLEGDAHALAFQVSRKGGSKVIQAITARTADWPRSARTQWNFLAEAVKPRGLPGLARDTVILLIGSALAIGVMILLKYLQVL